MNKILVITLLASLSALQTACAERKEAPANKSPSIAAAPEEPKSGCAHALQSGACVQYFWETVPGEGTEGSFYISITNPEAGSLGPTLKAVEENVSVVLWMPSMGHGSAPVEVERVAPGLYHATRVLFIMPGDWEIRIQLKDTAVGHENEVKDQVSISVRL